MITNETRQLAAKLLRNALLRDGGGRAMDEIADMIENGHKPVPVSPASIWSIAADIAGNELSFVFSGHGETSGAILPRGQAIALHHRLSDLLGLQVPAQEHAHQHLADLGGALREAGAFVGDSVTVKMVDAVKALAKERDVWKAAHAEQAEVVEDAHDVLNAQAIPMGSVAARVKMLVDAQNLYAEHAGAWVTTAQALSEVVPYWTKASPVRKDAAVVTIRHLARGVNMDDFARASGALESIALATDLKAPFNYDQLAKHIKTMVEERNHYKNQVIQAGRLLGLDGEPAYPTLLKAIGGLVASRDANDHIAASWISACQDVHAVCNKAGVSTAPTVARRIELLVTERDALRDDVVGKLMTQLGIQGLDPYTALPTKVDSLQRCGDQLCEIDLALTNAGHGAKPGALPVIDRVWQLIEAKTPDAPVALPVPCWPSVPALTRGKPYQIAPDFLAILLDSGSWSIHGPDGVLVLKDTGRAHRMLQGLVESITLGGGVK